MHGGGCPEGIHSPLGLLVLGFVEELGIPARVGTALMRVENAG